MAQEAQKQHSQNAAQQTVDDFQKALGPFVVAAETTRMAMIFTDAQTPRNPLVFANDSFLALTGFSRTELLGNSLSALFGRVSDQAALAAIEHGVARGVEGTWELECRRAGGTEFLAAVYYSPVRDDQDVIRQNFFSFVDLSKHVGKVIEQRDELYALYERAPGFIATSVGPDHRFSFANVSFKRLVGRERLIGLTLAEAIPEMAGQEFQALLDHVYASGQRYVGKGVPFTFADTDGGERQRYIDFEYQPVRDASDCITGLFCQGYDVTEQELAKGALRALQSQVIHLSRVNAMETMATTLAHELNQPLAAIASYAAGARRMIDAGDASAPELIEVLGDIGESSERAGKIIHHLRDLTRSGKTHREQIDVRQVIGESMSQLQIGGSTQVHIQDLSPRGIMVEADPIQIQQVIVNLLRNACEATEEAGRTSVTVRTSVSADLATISIYDAGSGVPADVAQSGFNWITSSKASGMGVGLSIVRTIVESHGGKLWLESSSPEGSCFAFSLPCHAADQAAN